MKVFRLIIIKNTRFESILARLKLKLVQIRPGAIVKLYVLNNQTKSRGTPKQKNKFNQCKVIKCLSPQVIYLQVLAFGEHTYKIIS